MTDWADCNPDEILNDLNNISFEMCLINIHREYEEDKNAYKRAKNLYNLNSRFKT